MAFVHAVRHRVRRRWWLLVGGKGGCLPPLFVLEGQTSRYVDGQTRLVVLDDQNVVAAAVDDLLAEVTLTEDGIAGKDAALHRHDAEQLQGGLVLVGLGVHTQLHQDGLRSKLRSLLTIRWGNLQSFQSLFNS